MEEKKQQQKDEKLDRLLGYYTKVNEEVEHYDTEGAFLKFEKSHYRGKTKVVIRKVLLFP